MTEPEKRPETEPTPRASVDEGLTLAVFVALLFPACMVCLFWFGTVFLALPFNLVPGLAGLAVAALLFAVTTIPGDGRWRPFLQKASKAVAALALAALMGVVGWNAYQNSITIPNFPEVHLDANLYQPFREGSRIARLEGEAALRFSAEDDLPILNGVPSLFPLYAAMVNATYPAEAFPSQVGGNAISSYLNTMGYYRFPVEDEIDIFFDTAPQDAFEDIYYLEGSDVPMQLERIPLGGQGLVFFTHADNPVEGLTRNQLRGIYAGEIANWAQVGGEDTPILPYQRHWNSDIQAALVRFMGDTPLAQAPTEERRYLSGDGGEYLADYRNTPGAIGFTFSAYADQLREKYHIKLLAVDGVYPDGAAIGQGDYPIADPIYLLLRPGEQSQEVDRFTAWALGEEGQELMARAGYVPAAKIEQ